MKANSFFQCFVAEVDLVVQAAHSALTTSSAKIELVLEVCGAVRRAVRSGGSLKTGTAAPAFYFSLRDQLFYLVCPLCFCLGQYNSVSRRLCVTPPFPNPTAALRSAAGHVSHPVREVTRGPVFWSPLHLLVPVCAVCHRAFPLQDPAGL